MLLVIVAEHVSALFLIELTQLLLNLGILYPLLFFNSWSSVRRMAVSMGDFFVPGKGISFVLDLSFQGAYIFLALYVNIMRTRLSFKQLFLLLGEFSMESSQLTM